MNIYMCVCVRVRVCAATSTLTSDELRECYKRAQDAYETTGLLLVRCEDLLTSETVSMPDGTAVVLTPSAQGKSYYTACSDIHFMRRLVHVLALSSIKGWLVFCFACVLSYWYMGALRAFSAHACFCMSAFHEDIGMCI
jgi:hypothetical protein